MNEQLSFLNDTKNILLSLREEYYNDMLSGKKHYEYRTRFLKEKTTAYIYISKTKKKIVAKIEFGIPIIGTATEIARIAENDEPGCFDDMISYFYNDIGYAIPIEKIIPIEEISLEELKSLFSDFVVPQSYYILDKKKKLLEFLQSRKSIENEIYRRR